MACIYSEDIVDHNVFKVTPNEQPWTASPMNWLAWCTQSPVAIMGIFVTYHGPGRNGIEGKDRICPLHRTLYSNRIECPQVMLPVILDYTLSIHKLLGATVLNPGKEFALGLTLHPFPNFDRLKLIKKCSSLRQRLWRRRAAEDLRGLKQFQTSMPPT